MKALAIAVKNMDARRRVTLLKHRQQASLSLGSLSLYNTAVMDDRFLIF